MIRGPAIRQGDSLRSGGFRTRRVGLHANRPSDHRRRESLRARSKVPIGDRGGGALFGTFPRAPSWILADCPRWQEAKGRRVEDFAFLIFLTTLPVYLFIFLHGGWRWRRHAAGERRTVCGQASGCDVADVFLQPSLAPSSGLRLRALALGNHVSERASAWWPVCIGCLWTAG